MVGWLGVWGVCGLGFRVCVSGLGLVLVNLRMWCGFVVSACASLGFAVFGLDLGFAGGFLVICVSCGVGIIQVWAGFWLFGTWC